MTDNGIDDWSAVRVAGTLLAAEHSRTPRTSIHHEWPGLTLDVAYAAQDIALADRRSRGETVTGIKLGLTSRAKQKQMGVDEPSVAWLTDAMVLPALRPLAVHCQTTCAPGEQELCLAEGANALSAAGAFPWPFASPAQSLIPDADYWTAPRFPQDVARLLARGGWEGCR